MNHVGALGRMGTGLSTLLLNMLIIFIVFNNMTYQTRLQLDQSLFVFSVFVILIVFWGVEGWRLNRWFVVLLLILGLYTISSIILGPSQKDYINRALFSCMAAFSYLTIFFVVSKRRVPVLHFYAFLIFFLAGAAYIASTSDRDLFNPNWYAMTLFYLFALTRLRERAWLLFALALIFAVIYGSRGAAVSGVAALVVILMSNLVGRRRYMLNIGFTMLTAAMFYFVYYLYASQIPLALLIGENALDERGLGGREGALIEAFSHLVESGYLGNGIGASTSFTVQDNIGIDKDVHVHFGFLDIFLKFGMFGFLFVYLFAMRLIHRCGGGYLPYVFGGLMTVFYYNGLATSHIGLNLLLYLLLGQAFHRGLPRPARSVSLGQTKVELDATAVQSTPSAS